MIKLCNINYLPCEYRIPTFEESIEYLPEPIAEGFKVLIKLYDVIEVEHLGIDESFDKYGCTYSTIHESGNNGMYFMEQEYNLRLIVEHKETKGRIVKLFKV